LLAEETDYKLIDFPDPNGISLPRDPEISRVTAIPNQDHRGRGCDSFYVDKFRSVHGCTTRYMGYKGKELVKSKVP